MCQVNLKREFSEAARGMTTDSSLSWSRRRRLENSGRIFSVDDSKVEYSVKVIQNQNHNFVEIMQDTSSETAGTGSS